MEMVNIPKFKNCFISKSQLTDLNSVLSGQLWNTWQIVFASLGQNFYRLTQ